MFRKTKNTGCFESIKEPMQMRYIRKVAEFADIDLKDIKIEIVRDPELIGTGFCGYTFPNGKHIQLYPDAFLNRETLVKTLGHERVHCEQTKLFGTATNDNELNQYENAARFSEDYWWQCFLERMSLFEK